MDKDQQRVIRPRDILSIILNNWSILFASFVSVVVTVSLMTFLSKPIYEASATLSIRQEEEFKGETFVLPALVYQKYLIENQVAILKSRRLIADVILKLKESDYSDSLSIIGDYSFQKMIKKFKSMTKVYHGRNTNLIELKAKSTNPKEAAILVNTWMETYLEYNKQYSKGEIVQTRKFLEQKVKEVDVALRKSERILRDFKKRNNIIAPQEETEQLITQLVSFQSLSDKTRTELESVNNQLSFLRKKLEESKINLSKDMTEISSPTIIKLRETLGKTMAERAQLEAQLVGEGFSVKDNYSLSQLDDAINGLKQKINIEIRKLVEKDFKQLNPLERTEELIIKILENETLQHALKAKLNVLDNIVQKYRKKLNTLPDKSFRLAQLERDVRLNTDRYIMLKNRLEEVRIQEAGQLSIARILDRAEPPLSPLYPKKTKNIMLGAIFGILLGLGLSFAREYYDDTIKREEDVVEMGLRVIGRVPAAKTFKHIRSDGYRKKDWLIERARKIMPYFLVQKNEYSSVAEAYRSIRTSIYFTDRGRVKRTLLITSSRPSEGKSTTAANLAVTIARKGTKTLLIDSDLRRPVLDVLFIGVHTKVGLTNYLAGEMEWRDVVRETSVEGLDILPAGVGVKNAAELLSTKRMISFVKEVKEEYKKIIFDSPPILPVTDGTILAAVVDGIILVVRERKTSIKDIRRSLNLLRDINTPILGAIITGIYGPDYYGYRDYYSHYLKEIEKESI